MRAAVGLLVLVMWAGAAHAEDAGCAEPATPAMPDAGATAPGNAATGWSGGLGGSHTGTSPQGATADSRSWQPPTARGVDLKGEAEVTAAC